VESGTRIYMLHGLITGTWFQLQMQVRMSKSASILPCFKN
jgi:hypothetical protein